MPRIIELKDKDISKIKEQYKAGATIDKLRKAYGVGFMRIAKIVDKDYKPTPTNAGKRRFKTEEERQEEYKVARNKAESIFNSISIGDYVEISHYDDTLGRYEKCYNSINVHAGTVISKNDKVITVQESAHKKQGITLSQILSKQVRVLNIIKAEKAG